MTRRGMYCDTPNISIPHFNFACVKARSQWQANLRRRRFECQCAPDRASGAVERREYSVSCCFDQLPAMFFDHSLCGPIMLIEQTTP